MSQAKYTEVTTDDIKTPLGLVGPWRVLIAGKIIGPVFREGWNRNVFSQKL